MTSRPGGCARSVRNDGRPVQLLEVLVHPAGPTTSPRRRPSDALDRAATARRRRRTRPGTLVSKRRGARSQRPGAPAARRPGEDEPPPSRCDVGGSQSVWGRAPMSTNSAAAGRPRRPGRSPTRRSSSAVAAAADDLVGERTSMFGVRVDLVDQVLGHARASERPRTTSVTCRRSGQCSAACPAELPPPTTNASRPGRCASDAELRRRRRAGERRRAPGRRAGGR